MNVSLITMPLAFDSIAPGFVFLICSIICSSLFSIVFKLCQIKELDSWIVIAFNYFFGFIVSSVPVIAKIVSGDAASDYALQPTTLGLAALQGIMYTSGFIFTDNSIWRSGVALTTAVARSSLLLPVVLSAVLLGQAFPAWYEVVLVLAALLLIVLPNKPQYHDAAHRRSPNDKVRRRKSIIFLIVVFLVQGTSDFMLKVTQNTVVTDTQIEALSPVIFLMASFASLTICLVKGRFKNSWFNLKTLLFGLILGVANVSCTGCMLRALMVMPTAKFYPLYNIGLVLMGVITGLLIFREKVHKSQLLGVLLATVAVALLSGLAA